MTEGMIFAIAAAQQALKDANWMPEDEEERERTVKSLLIFVRGIRVVIRCLWFQGN